VTDPVLLAVWAGVLAGFGIAMPVGPVAVMVLREGMVNGRRSGLAAGAGVATVDLAYCGLAVGAGAVLEPVIRLLGPWPGYVGGAVLILLAAWQLRPQRQAGTPGQPALPARGAVFVRFVAMTAVNPATLLYFFALAGALPSGMGWAFVLGAAAASLGWQSGLALVGSTLGAAVSPRLVTVLGYVSAALVLGLGVALIVSTAVRG
jgi:threonine/homoserine/homoserine lactone efflux protein